VSRELYKLRMRLLRNLTTILMPNGAKNDRDHGTNRRNERHGNGSNERVKRYKSVRDGERYGNVVDEEFKLLGLRRTNIWISTLMMWMCTMKPMALPVLHGATRQAYIWLGSHLQFSELRDGNLV
jgi:hypothetical protein